VSESRVAYEVRWGLAIPGRISERESPEAHHPAPLSAAEARWWSRVDGIYETLEGAEKAIRNALSENFRSLGVEQLCSMTRGPRYELEVYSHRWNPPDFYVKKVTLR